MPRSVQRRSLFTSTNRSVNYRRLAKLEQEANASSTNPLKQAELYKVRASSPLVSFEIFV